MPTIGPSSEAGTGTDYVILGSHDSWSTAQPTSLTIDSKGTRDVAKETYDYMSRGWILEDGTYNGMVKLEDGLEVPVTIEVSTVC